MRKEDPFTTTYNDHILTTSDHTKFLGIEIDSELNWKEHVQYLAKKISSFTYALRIVSNSVNEEAALTAYYSYVNSRITYGIIFWGNSADSPRIFRLQKSCIRSIFHLRKRESCRELFKEKHILTLPSLYVYQCACFVKENYNEFFSRYETNHAFNTRGCATSFLRQPQTIFTKVQRNAVTQLIKIYNKIPNEYKNLLTKNFKVKLKTYLSNQSFYSISEYFNHHFDLSVLSES